MRRWVACSVFVLIAGPGSLPLRAESVRLRGAPAEAEADAPSLGLATRSAVFTRARLLSETAWTENSLTEWHPVFATTVTLRGTRRQCIAIDYSATMYGISTQIRLRAVVDGVPVVPEFTWRAAHDANDTAALSWWKCGLASNGRTHLVRVEFSAMNPNGAGFGPRTLAIRYDQ